MASKLNIVVRLQHWMDSVPGQTFLNYAYSWGAAVVILGALFKLTHLPGGNLMLFLGMGTEAVVFFLAAFDRPFDKKEIGKELADDFETDEEIEQAELREQLKHSGKAPQILATPTLATPTQEKTEDETISALDALLQDNTDATVSSSSAEAPAVEHTAPTSATTTPAPNYAGGASTIIIGNAQAATVAPQTAAPASAEGLAQAISAHYESPEGSATVEQEADKLATIIRMANDELLRRAQAVLSPEMEAATQEYIAKLQTLNDTLTKVDEQSARLTRDSQEMENLNRTLVGINKVYDLHFASISRQVTTIEDINTQTQQLAAKIEEVNRIYARMMQTLNIMGNPMGMANAGAETQNTASLQDESAQ